MSTGDRVSERTTVFSPEGQIQVWTHPQEALQVLDFADSIGRREWTRTTDPHHVKVVRRTFKPLFLLAMQTARTGKYTPNSRAFRHWICQPC